MDAKKVQTLLSGIAAINALLAKETEGDGYFEAIVDRFATNLIMAGTGLQGLLRDQDPDATQELEPLVTENAADTREFPAVTVYDEKGQVAS